MIQRWFLHRIWKGAGKEKRKPQDTVFIFIEPEIVRQRNALPSFDRNWKVAHSSVEDQNALLYSPKLNYEKQLRLRINHYKKALATGRASVTNAL